MRNLAALVFIGLSLFSTETRAGLTARQKELYAKLPSQAEEAVNANFKESLILLKYFIDRRLGSPTDLLNFTAEVKKHKAFKKYLLPLLNQVAEKRDAKKLEKLADHTQTLSFVIANEHYAQGKHFSYYLRLAGGTPKGFVVQACLSGLDQLYGIEEGIKSFDDNSISFRTSYEHPPKTLPRWIENNMKNMPSRSGAFTFDFCSSIAAGGALYHSFSFYSRTIEFHGFKENEMTEFLNDVRDVLWENASGSHSEDLWNYELPLELLHVEVKRETIKLPDGMTMTDGNWSIDMRRLYYSPTKNLDCTDVECLDLKVTKNRDY